MTSYELTLDGSQVTENKTPSSKPASGEVNPNTGAEVLIDKYIIHNTFNSIN